MERCSEEVLVGISQVREGKSDIFFNGYCGGWLWVVIFLYKGRIIIGEGR